MSYNMRDISENDPFGKTLRTFEVDFAMIDELYEYGDVEFEEGLDLYPNQPIVLKAGQQSALGVVSNTDSNFITRTDPEIEFFGIRGRNKEQKILLHLLQDPEIRVIVVTGPAGTGKTVICGGYALDQVLRTSDYKKMILSKPLEICTGSRFWGTVPGGEEEKFSPFLKSFALMFENMIGTDGVQYVETAIKKRQIEFFPLELMRGATLRDSIVWYDEAQNMNYHECATLGTRIDDVGNSKLVLTGDLNQRDRRIERDRTGLHKLVNSPFFQNSPFTAHVNLTKIERGKIAQLFHDVFERDEP